MRKYKYKIDYKKLQVKHIFPKNKDIKNAAAFR